MTKFSRTPITSYRCKWSLRFVFCATAAKIPDLRTAALMNFILKRPLVNKASLPLDTYNMQSYHNNFEKKFLAKFAFWGFGTNQHGSLVHSSDVLYPQTRHATLCCQCCATRIRVSLTSYRDVQHVRNGGTIMYMLSPLRVCIFSLADVGTNGVHYFRSMYIPLTG